MGSTSLFEHILFLKADAHLWTIPQEMFFYLCLPIIMVGLYWLAKLPRFIMLACLVLMSGILIYRPTLVPVNLYAFGKTTAPFIGWFMLGITVAFLQPSRVALQDKLSGSIKPLLSYFGILLFVGIALMSTKAFTAEFLSPSTIYPFQRGAELGIACTILLFLVILLPNSKLSALFAHPVLRSVGVIGFSFYLLHPTVIGIIRDLSIFYFNYRLAGLPMLILAGLITWVVASLTYALIERPFLRHRIATIT